MLPVSRYSPHKAVYFVKNDFLGMLHVPLILSLAPQVTVASLLRHILMLPVSRYSLHKAVCFVKNDFLGMLHVLLLNSSLTPQDTVSSLYWGIS